MTCKPNHMIVEQLPETLDLCDNSIGDMLNRRIGRVFKEYVPIIRGIGTHIINVFKVTGTVLILNQFAQLATINNLTDCTNVYASLCDGVTTKILTADGIDLSGVPVGSMFFKEKDETQTYTLLDSTTCKAYEPSDKKEGKPFYAMQKSGVDTFVRLHLTTTSGVDFIMYTEFEYRLINGAKLELA